MKKQILFAALVGVLNVSSFAAFAWDSDFPIRSCNLNFQAEASTNNKESLIIVTDEVSPITYYFLFDADDAVQLEKGKAMQAACLTAQTSGTLVSVWWEAQTYSGTTRKIFEKIQVGPN